MTARTPDRGPAWIDRVARRVSRRVRWATRIRWLAAAATVLGAAAVVLAPAGLEEVTLHDVGWGWSPGPVASRVVRAAPGRAPVKVRLQIADPAGEDLVEIRF